MKLFLFFMIALCWGGSYVAIHEVVQSIPPIEAGFARMLVSFLLLAVILKATNKRLSVSRAFLWKIWIAGLFAQGIPFIFLFWGETKISAGLGGILNGTVPIWTAIVGMTVYRGGEKLDRKKILGLVLGFIGLGIIFLPSLTVQGSRDEFLGCLSLVIMAISYGLGIQMNRRILTSPGTPDVMTNLFQQQLSSVIFLFLVSVIAHGFPEFKWLHHARPLGAILYLGWISSMFAFVIFFKLTREWGAVRTSTVTYLVPVFAMLLDLLLNHNAPSTYEVAGMAVVLCGTALIQGISIKQVISGSRFRAQLKTPPSVN